MDKETSLMKNLLWARILVKMKRSGRPTYVNLLARARSYEIQLWWEIQPRVTEVYPRRFRKETKMAYPRVEDEGKIRAAGRVTAEREATRTILREVQRDKGQRQALHKSGTGGSLCQQPKYVGITIEGSTSQCEIQKIMGERRREEGPKSPSDFSSHNLGLHHGDEVGQSPSGLQGVFVGQSPCHKGKAIRSTETSRLKDQKIENVGMLGEKTRGTVSPNFAKPQKSDTSGVEEEGGQKKRPTQNLGQRKDNTSKGGASSKVRRTSREVRGSQIDGKESSLHESDRDLNYGGYGRFNSEMGREIKACQNPNFREERSPASKSEDEGDDISQAGRTVYPEAECLGKVAGTWPMPLRKAWRSLPAHQEKEDLGSGQVSFTDCRSTSGEGSDLEVGRA